MTRTIRELKLRLDGKLMKFYHFTSPYHLKPIMVHGITRGVIPTGTLLNPHFVHGYQWLTINPEFTQSWNEGSSLPYNRCAFRLTIEIPRQQRNKIIEWLKVCDKISTMADDLNGYGDPQNWRLYHGEIPPNWIMAVANQNYGEVRRG
ncbi:MAG: hypothetical protein A4E53_00626 [Pelotomaculum sp. PtaB.Bin104]|nr:MAG: hypothetical protein A4E53_00626 [Pelotomaculum sp. PtaB.Bin104]